MGNRSFLRRVVTYLVGEAGERQFLDLGSGVPTVGNVHEVAQGIAPDAPVVYVDVDPVARRAYGLTVSCAREADANLVGVAAGGPHATGTVDTGSRPMGGRNRLVTPLRSEIRSRTTS